MIHMLVEHVCLDLYSILPDFVTFLNFDVSDLSGFTSQAFIRCPSLEKFTLF